MVLMAVSFWQQAALNAVGPLVTAVFGLLLAGVAVNFITRRVQDRRTANEVKYGLISEMAETAGSLYHHIAMYSRARMDVAEATGSPEKTAENSELLELRKKLLEQYPLSRARTEVLEARLTAYFEDPRVAIAWHAVRDCLTVRYHRAVGGVERRWDQVRLENSKGWERRYHTGLSYADLDNLKVVYRAYTCHLKTTERLVFACPLRPHRTYWPARRRINQSLEEAKNIGFDYQEPITTLLSLPGKVRSAVRTIVTPRRVAYEVTTLAAPDPHTAVAIARRGRSSWYWPHG